jgi:hypothetical protein
MFLFNRQNATLYYLPFKQLKISRAAQIRSDIGRFVDNFTTGGE